MNWIKEADKVLEDIQAKQEQKFKKRAMRAHTFAAKINTLQGELPVLKEIAKLLFEINENIKESR